MSEIGIMKCSVSTEMVGPYSNDKRYDIFQDQKNCPVKNVKKLASHSSWN